MSFELNQIDVMGLSDDQKAAVMDAIVVGVMGDGDVTEAESGRLDKELTRTPLAATHDGITKLVLSSRDRLMALKSKEERDAYIRRIADRLPLPHIREKVIYTMARIAYGNGKPSAAEQEIIEAFAKGFNVSAERMGLIAAQLKNLNRPAT